MMSRGRRLRAGGLAVLLVLGLAGCIQPSNTPTAYDDVTQQNFLQGCTANYQLNGTTSTLGTGEKESTCQCAYNWITANVPFSDFKSLDSDLGNNPENLPDNIKNGIEGTCPGFAGSTGAGPTTSAPAATTSTPQ